MCVRAHAFSSCTITTGAFVQTHAHVGPFVCHQTWFTASFKPVRSRSAFRDTKEKPLSFRHGSYCSVLLLAGTRHLHHTLTMVDIVWRDTRGTGHTQVLLRSPHTLPKMFYGAESFPAKRAGFISYGSEMQKDTNTKLLTQEALIRGFLSDICLCHLCLNGVPVFPK